MVPASLAATGSHFSLAPVKAVYQGRAPSFDTPTPNATAVMFQDPRPNKRRKEVGVIGFYHPGRDEAWDKLCGGGFCGNFWDLGGAGMRLTAHESYHGGPGEAQSFENAEAAFQSLKFWDKADKFANLNGDQAFQLKKSLAGQEDFTYARYGSNWAGMFACLWAKFAQNAELSEALKKTGDAYLLEHNSVAGRDKCWSDNFVGDGTNWLGLQLMLLRDQLQGEEAWMQYITKDLQIDMSTGRPGNSESADAWLAIVKAARDALVDVLSKNGGTAAFVPVCLRPGCGKATWNGEPGGYCGRRCKAMGPVGGRH